MDYRPREIEKKWRKFWEKNGVYQVSNESTAPKFYVLDMFPYPSGSGLHVGHPLGYIASDIFSRYKRMNGFNVLHPMGYDAFGLPAEQFAIESGVHPAISTAENIKRYRSQLENLGFSYDWSREVATSDPAFFKWTQWIFLQLFEHYYDTAQSKAMPISDLIGQFVATGNAQVEAVSSQEEIFSAAQWQQMSAAEQDQVLMNYRLAYRKLTFVNWCEALGTVLANDEVREGLSIRGGHPVERKPMLQWSLRITAYAERLLNDLDDLDWSDAMKRMQSNWIGRSEGAQLFFQVAESDLSIEIYTTRPDTIYGATFMVLAPEHDWVEQLTAPGQQTAVQEYVDYVKTRSERERQAEIKSVTGAFLGAYAINPLNGEKIPIWISEYVLKDYGTGAIMAVPADDERDHRFAEKFGLPIIEIIDKSMYPGATIEDKMGKMINSDFLNGMEVMDAIEAILQRIEQMGIGKRQVNYKLRDAIFSRQRYWGEPFPITYDAEGVAHALPLEELPLELPKLEDFKPASGGKSPLARLENWVQLDNGWRRETDTMPGFAGSSWYFLRYMDAHNSDRFASEQAISYWQDVDLYIGGTEHAVGHLMYSRFWHKFLYDKGLVPTKEPFRKLINQGMIQGVIEYLNLQKEKKDGFSRFVCAGIAAEEAKKGTEFIQIPVHIDFVQDYGTANSYFNTDSIKKFIDWRPEYQDAYFECGNGIFHRGIFSSKNGHADSHLLTSSEVGKMSKSKYNVINPDDVVDQYGADCFRMYEMFLGPIEQAKPWNTTGIDGVSKFLKKFWSLFYDESGRFVVNDEAPSKEELKILHTAIKKVREDVERFSFNTCVSAFMVAVNELKKVECRKKAVLEPLVCLVAPFAPFVAEELWHLMGHTESVHAHGSYPELDEQYLLSDVIKYPVSINGKTRAFAELAATASQQELELAAYQLPEIQKWIEGKTIRKIIVVPGRMINIVV
ncbi:MAG TPA: leucine--tRNA ligase [Saprospiraceae bacterium]|nr:leucine--tRNA ligase [Saprospiraceae bacterium]HMQ83886.1 leucine--tRNA ligase [Saprospiraceae bacterium]